MHNKKYDPSMEKLKPGSKVGIVGESHIWDGPLDQVGRPHGEGLSSGIYGKEVLKANLYHNNNEDTNATKHGLVYDLKTDKFVPIEK